MPWLLAAAAAQQLQRFMQHPRLAGFGRGAAPAVVGLLGVTALTIKPPQKGTVRLQAAAEFCQPQAGGFPLPVVGWPCRLRCVTRAPSGCLPVRHVSRHGQGRIVRSDPPGSSRVLEPSPLVGPILREHAGVNRPSVQIRYVSVGVTLMERRTVILRSDKPSPSGDGR